MKWIVGFLVLANLAIFLMIQQEPSQIFAEKTVLEPPEKGGLRLLSEVDAEKATDDAPTKSSSTGEEKDASSQGSGEETGDKDGMGENNGTKTLNKPGSPANNETTGSLTDTSVPTQKFPEICGSLGPIKTGSKARQLSGRLEAAGLEVSLSNQSRRVPYRYRVLVPPLANRKQASEMLAQMQKAGLDDLQRLSQGEFRNGISLGTFSTQENAATRRKTVADRGFKTDIAIDYERITENWIDYRYENPERAESLKTLRQENPGLTTKDLDCPHIVSG